MQKSPLHARLLRAAPAAGGSDSSWRGFGGTGGGRTCEGTVSPAVRQREGVAEDRTPKCLTAAEGAHRNGCVSAHRCREAARTPPPPDSRWAPRAPGAVWKPGRVGHAISRRPAHVLRGTFQTWTARRLRSPNSGPRPPRPENRGSQTSARLWDPREESGHRPGHLGLIPDVSHPGRVLDRISRIQAWYQACEVFCFCVPGAHAGARTWTRGPSAPNACCLWPPPRRLRCPGKPSIRGSLGCHSKHRILSGCRRRGGVCLVSVSIEGSSEARRSAPGAAGGRGATSP